jgi:hypothetical protein
VVLVGGVIVVAVAGGAISLSRQQKGVAPKQIEAPDSTSRPDHPVVTSTLAATGPGSVRPAVPVGSSPPAPAPALPAKAFETTLAMGRTDLSDSVYAMRADSGVRVFFDTQMGRTRRRDKFEQIVRSTLPKVYGEKAASALALVPEGNFAVDGNLIDDLPARGIRLAVPTGGVIVIWPETREGRDGPLVVSYRTVVER